MKMSKKILIMAQIWLMYGYMAYPASLSHGSPYESEVGDDFAVYNYAEPNVSDIPIVVPLIEAIKIEDDNARNSAIDTIFKEGSLVINAADERGMTALVWAFHLDRPRSLIDRLLKAGADIDVYFYPEDHDIYYALTPLLWAVRADLSNRARLLLTLKADPTKRVRARSYFSNGLTGAGVLDLAALNGNAVLLDLFLSKAKLDPNSFYKTYENKQIFPLNELLKGMTIAQKSAGNADHKKQINDQYQGAFNTLVKHGACVHYENPAKNPLIGSITPLLTCLYDLFDKEETEATLIDYIPLEMLMALAKGIDLRMDIPLITHGKPLLIEAATLGADERVLGLLLDHKADVNVRGVQGNTVLMELVLTASLPADHTEKIIRFLVGRGANPLLRNEQGHTAADLAQQYNELLVPLLKAAEKKYQEDTKASSSSSSTSSYTVEQPKRASITKKTQLVEGQKSTSSSSSVQVTAKK